VIDIEKLNEDGVISLIGGIVQKAAQDYRWALIKDIRGLINDCESFFLGKYFETLTDLNGQALVDKIRRDVEMEKRSGQASHNGYRKFIGDKHVD